MYWTPTYNRYPLNLEFLLFNSIQGKKEAIAKYRRQSNMIRDANIAEILQRIILDEEAHVKGLTCFYDKIKTY